MLHNFVSCPSKTRNVEKSCACIFRSMSNENWVKIGGQVLESNNSLFPAIPTRHQPIATSLCDFFHTSFLANKLKKNCPGLEEEGLIHGLRLCPWILPRGGKISCLLCVLSRMQIFLPHQYPLVFPGLLSDSKVRNGTEQFFLLFLIPFPPPLSLPSLSLFPSSFLTPVHF